MRLTSILGNSQRLDGGAMFGNAPRALWSRWIEPDERNRIPLACRCLLVKESRGRHVLLEAGIGTFFEPKLEDRFGVQERQHVLKISRYRASLISISTSWCSRICTSTMWGACSHLGRLMNRRRSSSRTHNSSLAPGLGSARRTRILVTEHHSFRTSIHSSRSRDVWRLSPAPCPPF